MTLLTSKTIRAGMTLVMAAGVLAGFSGCTDNEIAATALVIGAAAIASSDDSPRGGVVVVREHRHEHWRDHDGYRRYPHDLAAAGASAALDAKIAASSAAARGEFVSKDERVIKLAQNYDISHYAATYVVRAIVMAQAKDLTGVKELGLSTSDFQALYAGKEMSAASVDALAAKLRMDEASATRLVQEMTADVQAEKAARGLN